LFQNAGHREKPPRCRLITLNQIDAEFDARFAKTGAVYANP
jgi:hypothetical protein